MERSCGWNPTVTRIASRSFSQELSAIGNYSTLVGFGLACVLISCHWCLLKGQCHEIFCFWFFSWISFPRPRVLHLDRFEFFKKFSEIFASQGAPPVSTTPVANLPPVSATTAANFYPIFASVVDDTGGKFATGVNDTGGKFATGVNDAGGKLPTVSMTPAANNIRLQTP